MNSEVKVSYLSEEELMKVRIGAKCDLENRHEARQSRRRKDWKWRSEKANAASRKFGGITG